MAPSPGRRLRALLKRGGLACPGVFNPVTARLVEAAGFEAGYISGAGLHAAEGLSDTGLLSLERVAEACGRIARAARIPFLLDGDTGFGGVSVAVRLFERAGAAGVQIEDQRFPKRCGHLPGKELVEAEEMAAKVRAAVKARRDRDFLVVARTDARGVTGYADAVARARRYLAAGADAVFPEALTDRAEFCAFAKDVPAPLIANMTEFGRTPLIPLRDFRAMGYAAVLFPMTLFRAAMGSMEDALHTLKKTGTQKTLLRRMQTRQDFYRLIGYDPGKN